MGKVLKLGCGGLIGLFVLIMIIGALAGGNKSGATPTPATNLIAAGTPVPTIAVAAKSTPVPPAATAIPRAKPTEVLDSGRPSNLDARIHVPSAAVRDNDATLSNNATATSLKQIIPPSVTVVANGRPLDIGHSTSEIYLVPGSKAQNVLTFYQRTLPADGWKIDTKSSDPDGKSPGTGGTRILNFCKAPADWRSVLIGSDDASGTKLTVMILPDTDPCR